MAAQGTRISRTNDGESSHLEPKRITGEGLPLESILAAKRFILVLATDHHFDIIMELIDGPKDVTTLANAVGVSLARISQNLAVLRALNFVRGRQAGQRRIYCLHESWRIVEHSDCIFISTSNEPTVQLCLGELESSTAPAA